VSRPREVRGSPDRSRLAASRGGLEMASRRIGNVLCSGVLLAAVCCTLAYGCNGRVELAGYDSGMSPSDAGGPSSGSGTGIFSSGSGSGSSVPPPPPPPPPPSFDAGFDSSISEAGVDTGVDVSVPIDAAGGDTPGRCVTPEGGLTCTPGEISCGTSECNVPAQVCCDLGQSETCQSSSAPCAGTPISCNEAADCAAGEICCMESTSTTLASAKVSCLPGTCPVPRGSIVAVQVCRSNNECASGQCQFWSCLGKMIESCANPVPNSPTLCQLMN